MGTTICVLNQKGGCGKSTTTFHLAGAFAASGRKVLLVDMDPQGSLSRGFFGSSAVEQLPMNETAASILTDSPRLPTPQVVRPTSYPGISILPANQHLAAFNIPQTVVSGADQFALRELLDFLDQFDVTLIDCPPNLYLCSWAALLAADHVIIPVPPEDFGTQGLVAVHQTIDFAQQLNPTLNLLGHLITRRDQRLVIHRLYEERIRLLYPHTVLKTVVPEAVAFKVALAVRSPVQFDQPNSAAAEVMRELATECLQRMSNEQPVQSDISRRITV